MANLFTSLNPQANPTKGEMKEIAKTGIIPSHLKNPEDKAYMAIVKSPTNSMFSQLTYESGDMDVEIDGEVIIETGRRNTYKRICELINADAFIDLMKSIVLVEGVDISSGISLYRFLELCISKYPDEEAGIDYDIMSELIKESEEVVKGLESCAASGYGSAGTILNNTKPTYDNYSNSDIMEDN